MCIERTIQNTLTEDKVSLFSCFFFLSAAAVDAEKRLSMSSIDRITGARSRTHIHYTHLRVARDTLIFCSTAQVRFISGECCYINIRLIVDTTNLREKIPIKIDKEKMSSAGAHGVCIYT